MGRRAGKTKLEFIENGKARHLTFKRRREGATRKIKELTTLCDVSACLIIYAPEHAGCVWPPNDPALVDELIWAKYPNLKNDDDVSQFGVRATKTNSKKEDDGSQLGVRLGEIAQRVRAELDGLKSDQQRVADQPDQLVMPSGGNWDDDGKAQLIDQCPEPIIDQCSEQQQQFDLFGGMYHGEVPSTGMPMMMDDSFSADMSFWAGFDDQGESCSTQTGMPMMMDDAVSADTSCWAGFDDQGASCSTQTGMSMMMDDAVSADMSCWAGFDDQGASCSTQTAGGDDDVAAVHDDFYDQHDDFAAQFYTPPPMTWTDDDELKFTQSGAADFWKCIDFNDMWA